VINLLAERTPTLPACVLMTGKWHSGLTAIVARQRVAVHCREVKGSNPLHGRYHKSAGWVFLCLVMGCLVNHCGSYNWWMDAIGLDALRGAAGG